MRFRDSITEGQASKRKGGGEGQADIASRMPKIRISQGESKRSGIGAVEKHT